MDDDSLLGDAIRKILPVFIVGSIVSIYQAVTIPQKYVPERVYEVDVNKDGRNDIVTESKNGNLVVFLKNEDGGFQSLEDNLVESGRKRRRILDNAARVVQQVEYKEGGRE